MASKTYAKLMARAATGDLKAARALLIGEWWCGDPDSPTSLARVVSIAQMERNHRYQVSQLTTNH